MSDQTVWLANSCWMTAAVILGIAWIGLCTRRHLVVSVVSAVIALQAAVIAVTAGTLQSDSTPAESTLLLLLGISLLAVIPLLTLLLRTIAAKGETDPVAWSRLGNVNPTSTRLADSDREE